MSSAAVLQQRRRKNDLRPKPNLPWIGSQGTSFDSCNSCSSWGIHTIGANPGSGSMSVLFAACLHTMYMPEATSCCAILFLMPAPCRQWTYSMSGGISQVSSCTLVVPIRTLGISRSLCSSIFFYTAKAFEAQSDER